MRPRRNDGGEIVLTGAIWIYVGLYLLASLAGARDGRRQLRHLAPHGVLGDFEVDDVHRHMRAPADLNGFSDRFENPPAFRAHVRRIAAPKRRGRLAHGDQRIGIDPRSRRPAERAAHAKRALLHGLAHQRAHLVELGRGRRSRLLAAHISPDLARPDVSAHIGRDALAQQAREVAVEIGPVGRRIVEQHPL